MAKVLVIPDVHLKPWIFDRAAQAKAGCDVVVVLGDLVDDWGRQDDRDSYLQTIEAAIRFAGDNPKSLWCYGNHDYCYLHFDEGVYNTGFSGVLKHFVKKKLRELENVVGDRFKVVHEVDGVFFSHGGISESYLAGLRSRLGDETTLEECVEFTNEVASSAVLWKNDSPLWFRPERGRGSSGGASGLTQVVGHTPVERPMRFDGILVTDTFSTYSTGAPIGNQVLVVFDTETGKYEEA